MQMSGETAVVVRIWWQKMDISARRTEDGKMKIKYAFQTANKSMIPFFYPVSL